MLMPLEVSGAHLHVLNTAIYSFTVFHALGMNLGISPETKKLPFSYKKTWLLLICVFGLFFFHFALAFEKAYYHCNSF